MKQSPSCEKLTGPQLVKFSAFYRTQVHCRCVFIILPNALNVTYIVTVLVPQHVSVLFASSSGGHSHFILETRMPRGT
jgi:hypothetical protein